MRKTISIFTPLNLKQGENQQANQLITHRLKPKRRQDWETRSISITQKSVMSTNELLSSISTKLNPRSISISSQNKISNIKSEKAQIKVSCLDQIMIPNFRIGVHESSLNFEELRRRAAFRNVKNIVVELACVQKTKKICTDPICSLKQKWKSKLVLEIKDAQEAQKLKTYVHSTKQPTKHDLQIDKDVTRSFPDKNSSKAKLTLYHKTTEKNNLIQILRTVLRMLAISDPDVGYVQGMNLFIAVIVSHIKEIQLSYMFVKQVMKYGNMRKMYINNFKNMKQLCHNLFHRHIKILIPDLYQVFCQGNVTSQFFMPFYLSMFACVIEYNFMPTIIDQFMMKGFLFLDRLLLSVLCYFKQQLLQCDSGEVACKLGSSYIRSREVPWIEVINYSQTVDLN